MGNRLLTLSCLLSFLAVGCHFFDDADEIDDCPLNSGYPCACTYEDALVARDGQCLDGSACLYWGDDKTHGVCAEACDGVTDVTSCTEINGYGNEGLCWFQTTDADAPNYCAVLCDGDGMGNCAPGMSCLEDGSEYRYCLPNTVD